MVSLLAAWEWARLVDLPGTLWRAMYVLVVAVLLAAAWGYPEHARTVFLIAVLWWGASVVLLAAFEPGWLHSRWLWGLLGLSGFVVLVPTWLAVVHLHAQRPGLLVFLVVLVSMSDVFAYFAAGGMARTSLPRA